MGDPVHIREVLAEEMARLAKAKEDTMGKSQNHTKPLTADMPKPLTADTGDLVALSEENAKAAADACDKAAKDGLGPAAVTESAKFLEQVRTRVDRAMSEIRSNAAAVEARVKVAVEARAVEQSRVMQKTEEEMTRVQAGLHAITIRLTAIEGAQAEITKADKETRRRIGVSAQRMEEIETLVREIGAKAGDRFGSKLDALAAQVVGLVAMGQRLEASEKRSQDAMNAVEGLRRDQTAGFDDLNSGISILSEDVSKKLASFATKPEAKPEAKPEEKRR